MFKWIPAHATLSCWRKFYQEVLHLGSHLGFPCWEAISTCMIWLQNDLSTTVSVHKGLQHTELDKAEDRNQPFFLKYFQVYPQLPVLFRGLCPTNTRNRTGNAGLGQLYQPVYPPSNPIYRDMQGHMGKGQDWEGLPY